MLQNCKKDNFSCFKKKIKLKNDNESRSRLFYSTKMPRFLLTERKMVSDNWFPRCSFHSCFAGQKMCLDRNAT